MDQSVALRTQRSGVQVPPGSPRTTSSKAEPPFCKRLTRVRFLRGAPPKTNVRVWRNSSRASLRNSWVTNPVEVRLLSPAPTTLPACELAGARPPARPRTISAVGAKADVGQLGVREALWWNGRRGRFKIGCRKTAWGFKSLQGHHFNTELVRRLHLVGGLTGG